MTAAIRDRKLLFASIISGIYFALLFSKILHSIDSVLIGVVIELFTIPMILAQGAIIVYILYWIFIKKSKLSIEITIALLISIITTALMFIVK